MKINPILIVAGEPNSIFLEIFLKSINLKKYKSPIILVSSLKLLEYYKKKFNFKKKINLIDNKNKNQIKLSKKLINSCNKKNISINVWTVNSDTAIIHCKKLGVSGIITDRNELLFL